MEKRGQNGARVHLAGGELIDAPGYPVEVYNILGAGDAFGAGFLYGYVNGWDWRKSARLGYVNGWDRRKSARLGNGNSLRPGKT